MLGLIPARGGSKELPGKNILKLADKPLIAYTVEAALKAESIDRVVVSTDCQDIADVAERYGAEVPFLRPSELAQDDSQIIDTYIYTVDRLTQETGVEITELAVFLPTAPLRDHDDIDKAVGIFREKSADSVVSYYPAPHPVRWHRYLDEGGVLLPLFPEYEELGNRQEEPQAYLPNGAIYIFRYSILKDLGVYYTAKSYPYLMSQSRSIDVDTIEDFKLAEYRLST